MAVKNCKGTHRNQLALGALLLSESNVVCLCELLLLVATYIAKKEICLEMKFYVFWSGYSHYVMLNGVIEQP
jgi:hypothetical protein